MSLTLGDGRSTAYPVLFMGGGGGGGAGRFVFRHAYRAAPPAPDGTDQLVIEAQEVRWQEHVSGGGPMKTSATDAGPLRFVVSLPGTAPGFTAGA